MSELPDNNLLNNSDMMSPGSRANASTIKKKTGCKHFLSKEKMLFGRKDNASWIKSM